MRWEELTVQEVLNKVNSSEEGLTQSEASKRNAEYGLNVLQEKEKPSELKKFISQFTEPLMILLIIAGLVAFFIQDYIDSGVIFLVVIINAAIGYRQENKAENAMEKLKSMAKRTTNVIRGGERKEIFVEELTLGDKVILEEGDNIPADLRIIKAFNLKINESSLTGESLSVTKISDVVDEESHDNMLYMNTTVTRGKAEAIVIRIGMDTEIGKIASMIQDDEKETPLQIRIDKLGKTLGLLAIVICVFIFIVELLQGVPAANTFMTAVSLAVAAIPEGLPAVLTLTLALGMQKMAGNNAIVRKLLAVETLGSCSVICTDKTGTLTENKLTVTNSHITDLKMSSIISGFCNNAKVDKENDIKLGDPTDISMLEYAIDNNYDKNIDEKRLFEIPLDSERKRMTTIHQINNKEYVLIKGAPEILIDKCKFINHNGHITPLSEEEKESIKNNIVTFTDDALRVLLLCYKEIDDYTKYNIEELEDDLIFTGIVGMMDPPREEIHKSIETCKKAGITVKMITGDHENTAKAVAKLVGIDNPENVLTGKQLNNLSEDELKDAVQKVNVFARVFPEQKLKIVNMIQESDEIVAMTGDGVNDAPALTAANIGVSMGSGTDVAKKSSDMILGDDNFSTIVYAVKEGRTIFSNIKRFIKYQLSTNIAAIITILTSSIIAVPLPFNPVQLLWINIIMDGPPAQSLGIEKSDKNIMNNPPTDENILSKDNLLHITMIGLVMAVGTLGVYLYELSIGSTQLLASTIAFTTFVMYQIFNVFNCRSNSGQRNNTLILAVVGSFILQLCAVYIPILQQIFRTTAIPLTSWISIIIISLIILLAERIIRKFEKKIFK
ncbi:MAG: calcium-translocating P-type ATPase, PMCA-type [Methanosphaera stadtmanae]|nr:calcium-translocating P-type ATPase, PMCA-type [Methanosphaera stadtmanae]